MSFELGVRVVRKSDEQPGFIHNIRKNRVEMVEVRWESSGIKEWVPADSVRIWDKQQAPPRPHKTTRVNTTPGYLVNLRHKITVYPQKNRKKEQSLRERQLAADLLSLSDKRKNRTKMKAQKLIANFDRNITPQHTKRSNADWIDLLPHLRYAFKERIARDDRHDPKH